MNTQGKTVAIIGAGAAGLMAADHLSETRPDLAIRIYDAMPSPARKVLMAGKSGLNISHQSGLSHPEDFAAQYGDAAEWMEPMLSAFGTRDIIEWMQALGQESFTGSSGKIFPRTMKASPLLRALMKRLEQRGVQLVTRHRWTGWSEGGALLFMTPDGAVSVEADACLLALGGPSWPRLGTDGAALAPLSERGIESRPYCPANCGFDVDWPEDFVSQWAGAPVKSVRLKFGSQSANGDFVISCHADQSGEEMQGKSCGSIEGGAVYALSAPLRDAIERDGTATLLVDLRPHLTLAQLKTRLDRPKGKQSLSNHLRKSLKLQGLKAALLKIATDKAVMSDMDRLAESIKSLPVTLTRPRPIAEAISTAGGVLLDELDDCLMVKRLPGLFMAGEMLDWEAPTGGYLLTGCLSQGYRAAEGIGRYLMADD
nr:TIGR03862 family flavoprotein [uncultured Cohaesibacter sp.]